MGIPEKQQDTELEYIKRAMQQNSLGGQGVIAVEAQKKKQEQQIKEWLSKQQQLADQGYETLLQEVYRLAKDGLVTVHEEVEPIHVEDCFLDEEIGEIFGSENKNLQQRYALSDNVLLTFYEIAKQFLIDKRLTDAINSFTLLCLLNPDICSFWLSLGLAYDANQNWEEALDAFEIATQLDPTNFEPYLGLIRVGIAIKDFSLAKRYLEKATEIAPDQVNDALAFIKSQEEVS